MSAAAAPASPENTFDCIILGAGPGGYVAAIRAAQLGFKVAIVNKFKALGGTCLNVGCIPSKALLDSSELFEIANHSFAQHGIILSGAVGLDVPAMVGRKRKVVDDLTKGVGGLMKKNKVTVFHGHGALAGGMNVTVNPGDGPGADATAGQAIALTATKSILLATGSLPIELPFAKFDGDKIISSTGALELQAVPEHLVIVGGGYIGLELGSVWKRCGAKVTVIEALPKIVPFMDQDCADGLFKQLGRQGIEFMMETKVESIDTAGAKAVVHVATPDGGKQAVECDKVLICVGRRPYTDGLNLEAAGVQLDERRRVKTDEHFATTAPGIHAIGDVIAGPMLAHKAEEEGVAWAEMLAGKGGHVNYDVIPSVIYTWPEVSSVGLTEAQAREKHGDGLRIGKFPFIANGRAKAMAEKDGFVKVIAGPDDRLLGVHIFGPRASDMIAEATAVMEFGGTSEDIARTCHAHPTLSEALKEAALAADGRVIHS